MTRRYPTSEQLMAEAVAETGFEDFGEGDFREGLDVLLDSLEHDAGLDPSTDDAVIGQQRHRLANRLRVEEWYRTHPEIESLEVRGPLDVIGLPRTGTTAVGNVLSIEPQLRPLRGWEQSDPVPPPVLADEERDPRRIRAVEEDALVSPELKAMHLWDPHATLEDSEVLGMSFHGQQMTLPVYGYQAWWRRSDLTPTFHHHRRVIKLLQSQRPPNHWLFKAPHHKFHLEHIVAAYPDIKFVWTHRDPGKVVPSYTSLVGAIIPQAASGQHDQHRLGREICDHLREGMENAMAARARLGEERFLDIHHVDLIADPMRELKRVYEFAGMELTPETEAAMEEWHRVNRSGAHGNHKYTAEQFGLTTDQIRSDYDFYIRRFDVAVERRGAP